MPLNLGEVVNIVSDGNPQVGRTLVAGAIPYFTSVNVGTLTAVTANSTSEQTVTVAGVQVGDFVYVNKPTHQTGLGIVGARVSAANTVAIAFMNNTAGNLTPTASELYLVMRLAVKA
jgi:hypothetical protein